MKFGTDPDTAEVVRQRSAQRSAHKMRFGLLWLPAVAALGIAPQYADVHGGAALELVLDTPAPDLQRPHCIIGGVWVPAVLLQSGATLRCTVPAAPGLAAGAVTVQAGERGETSSLVLLLLMPPFPRLDGACGPWGPNHVLVARTGSSRRRVIGVGRIASTTAVGCYVVRGFNPGPTPTRQVLPRVLPPEVSRQAAGVRRRRPPPPRALPCCSHHGQRDNCATHEALAHWTGHR